MKTQLKICGLTNIQDAKAAFEAGADYLGFVLCENSPRGISDSLFLDLIKQLPKEAATVAVTQNRPSHEIRQLAKLAPETIIQLHGNERAEDVSRMTGIRFWKAIEFTSSKAFAECEEFSGYTLLLDSQKNGRSCNWNLAQLVARRRNIFLAGGITPENAASAIQVVKPFGIDVARGVEKAPGVKDHGMIKTLAETIRQINKEQEEEVALYEENYSF